MARHMTLDDLIAFASTSYAEALLVAEKGAAWNVVTIRAEGRDVEIKRLKEVYRRLKAVHAQSTFAHPDMPHRLAVAFAAEVFRATGAPTENDMLLERVGRSALELLQDEVAFGFPDINFDIPLSLDDTAALRSYLEEKRRFLLNSEKFLHAWGQSFIGMWASLFSALPDDAFMPPPASSDSALHLRRPIIQAMTKPAAAIEALMASIINSENEAAGLFAPLRRTLQENVPTTTGSKDGDKPILPSNCKEAIDRLPDIYLADTPFRALFHEQLPLVVTKQHRVEHCHIVAGTGHGKTQLMQSMMLADFDDPARPAVIAIDSQGDMLRTLSRLARFNPAHDDRLIIIDPADTDWPLRFNLFDVNRDSLDRLPRGEREQLLAGIIELYEYIFGALLGAELTQKQSVVFRFLAQLMLAIPNATIHTLRQLLEDPTPYWPFIEQLPITARTFLTDHLFASSKRGQKPNDYNATRSQVLRRLYGILSNPTFERLFSHPRNALDMKSALDSGKIILVNTAKDVLKSEASAIFGRYIIALILKAALERASDAKEARRPAFVYIDEAADYFDDSIDTLLIQARKYNVGITIAHQFLDQLAPGLRASVMSNPAIRFAGGLSAKDASALKEDMRTSSEFLLAARKRANATEFACFVRNLTPTATSYTLPLGQAEREPKMWDVSYERLLDRIRSEVAAPIAETDAHVGATPSQPQPAAPAVKGNTASEPDSFEDQY